MKKSVFNLIFLLFLSGTAFSMDGRDLMSIEEIGRTIDDVEMTDNEFPPGFFRLKTLGKNYVRKDDRDCQGDVVMGDGTQNFCGIPELAQFNFYSPAQVNVFNFYNQQLNLNNQQSNCQREDVVPQFRLQTLGENYHPIRMAISPNTELIFNEWTEEVEECLKRLILSGNSDNIRAIIFDCRVPRWALELIKKFKNLHTVKICSLNEGYTSTYLRVIDLERFFYELKNLKDVSIFSTPCLGRALITLAKENFIERLKVGTSRRFGRCKKGGRNMEILKFCRKARDSLKSLEFERCINLRLDSFYGEGFPVCPKLEKIIINNCSPACLDTTELRKFFDAISEIMPKLKLIEIDGNPVYTMKIIDWCGFPAREVSKKYPNGV